MQGVTNFTSNYFCFVVPVVTIAIHWEKWLTNAYTNMQHADWCWNCIQNETYVHIINM